MSNPKTPSAEPAAVSSESLEKDAKRALAAFIKRPSAKNYNATTTALRAIQNDYIAEFNVDGK